MGKKPVCGVCNRDVGDKGLRSWADSMLCGDCKDSFYGKVIDMLSNKASTVPCPFCGTVFNIVEHHVIMDGFVMVVCPVCKASGPSASGLESACHFWNHRDVTVFSNAVKKALEGLPIDMPFRPEFIQSLKQIIQLVHDNRAYRQIMESVNDVWSLRHLSKEPNKKDES